MLVPDGETIINHTLVKLIACEGHGLTAAEAALQLSRGMREKSIDLTHDIEKIQIRMHGPAMTIIDKMGELYNAADRDHCMQYIVAVVLLKSQLIEANDYQNNSPWASDPRVAAL